MPSLWAAYVPAYVLDDLNAGRLLGHERRFEAVALFADVSGFTAISEALASTGRRGAEELTDILNSYFAPMIDLIQSYGGIIGKFGGDAMTVLFPIGTNDAPPRSSLAARRAIHCALEMQARMGRYAAIPTSAGTFALAMKAGLAIGPVLCTTVGDPELRLEYVIAGRVLDECADAEHHATKGEVVVHNALLAQAPGARIAEERGAFSCVHSLENPPPPLAPQPVPALGEAAAQQIARFVHPTIAERLASGQVGFINEHRNVSVLFASFSGPSYDSDPDAGAKLRAYLAEVVRTVARYNGYLNKVDMGDKGSKYIVLFGAPVAYENDEERALRCALDLLAITTDPGSPGPAARIGVNTGRVYCGQVGSELRQEYTVMGDPVNLAARLMQSAKPGQVLVGESTRRPAADRFTWERLEPLRLKGKSEPVAAFALSGVSLPPALHLPEPRYALPMLGRAAELGVAETAIERARRGRGQIVGVSGEAGIGKSRLGAEIVRLATERGFTVTAGACQSYGAASSYLVWHDIWRGFFALDPTSPPEGQIAQLERSLEAIDARLVSRMPLLGILLNLPIADNELTRRLEPQLRAELLKSLLLDCLRGRVAASLQEPVARPQQPLSPQAFLMVLEDCHWIDPLSEELLEYLGRNIGDMPVALLVLHRPPIAGKGPLEWAGGLRNRHSISLAELPEHEARELVERKLRQLWGEAWAVPGELVAQLTERAHGNPFYLEELVNYLRDRAPDAASAVDVAHELPDSLQRLILSRIDQLPEEEKTTLKVASVIGRLFKARWLWGSYPSVGAPSDVARHLQTLSRLDLTPLDTMEPEPEYLFKHITTQEVAYESMAFATRATLHEHVGEFIEAEYAEALPQYLDVLAYHYGHTTNIPKQRHYFGQAAAAAKAAYANQPALDYYSRLLALLPEDERGVILLEYGEVLQLIGRWPEAEERYRGALALAEAASDARLRARCQTALGSLLSQTESYEEALRWLDSARAGCEQAGDEQGLSRALEFASFAHIQLGNYDQALGCANRQLELAQIQADKAGVSAAHGYIGLTWLRQGENDRALQHLQQALDVAMVSGNRRGAVLISTDIAGVYWQQGRYKPAIEQLQLALGAAREIGYTQAAGFTIGNAGTIYAYAGDAGRALACYGQALQTALEINDVPSALAFMGNIAIIYAQQGQDERADALYRQSIELEREHGIPYCLCDNLYHQAELYTQQGRYAEATALNHEALEIAAAIKDHDTHLLAQLLAIRLAVLNGTIRQGEGVAQLEALPEQWAAPAELAAINYTIWQIAPARRDVREVAAAQYRELYAHSPNAQYRERYAELADAELAPPPPLPDLAEELLGPPIHLDALLEQAGPSLAARKRGGS